MSHHNESGRLVNALFPVLKKLPPRERAVFARLIGGPAPQASADDDKMDDEVKLARSEFEAKLRPTDDQP